MKRLWLILLCPLTLLGAQNSASPPNRVELWNGRDLAGWRLLLSDPATVQPAPPATAPATESPTTPATVWSAAGDVLRFDTKVRGYIRTEKEFSNYRLHVEWRWEKEAPANANSGLLLHVHGPNVIWPLSFEAQLQNGNAGQVVGLGLDIPAAQVLNNRKRAPRLKDASENPPGDWNTAEILCRNDTIEVFVNGVRQNFVEKLPVSKGAIALQMEGFPIEFRRVWLEPL